MVITQSMYNILERAAVIKIERGEDPQEVLESYRNTLSEEQFQTMKETLLG